MTDIRGQLWLDSKSLILASSSHTRLDLLADAGLVAEPIPPEIDEREIEANLDNPSPRDIASHLARAKAENVARRYPDRIVVAADQTLEVEGQVLHKPADVREAEAHLARLQGRTHILHSAGAIARGKILSTFHDSARLTMRALDTSAIASYVRLAGESRVTASVGGYQLEGLGIHLFERVEGNHSTILGLPLIPLLTKLREMNLLAIL